MGPVFRPMCNGDSVTGVSLTGDAFASIVKKYAEKAGLPAAAESFPKYADAARITFERTICLT
jgi:hypothetical protein